MTDWEAMANDSAAARPSGGLTTGSLAVVAAGLRDPSSTTMLSRRLADATARGMTQYGFSAAVSSIELRPYAADLADALVTGTPSSELAGAIDAVTGADGLIAVTPTFAGSYAGLFKSFFDVLHRDALAGKPTALAATGGSARHSLVIDYALRPLLRYFRAAFVPTGVFAAAEDFDAGPQADRLTARIERAGAELAASVHARMTGRIAV